MSQYTRLVRLRRTKFRRFKPNNSKKNRARYGAERRVKYSTT